MIVLGFFGLVWIGFKSLGVFISLFYEFYFKFFGDLN